MRRLVLVCILMGILTLVFSQEDVVSEKGNKGELYFYWGWNWSGYNHSDIQFKGNDYDFTLKSVIAKDRQSTFSYQTYFHPKYITIPQYNFRIGYYFKNNWDLSFGIDHMKYVVQQDQSVEISGHINTGSDYDGIYSGETISITEDFLTFEHSDGLNYINFDLRHSDPVFKYGKMKVNLIEGVGLGFILPKTNTRLLENDRHDEFHLSGFGMSLVGGVNITLYDKFFIQTEFKGGYINLPDVRTTLSSIDQANHDFFFYQYNVLFGGRVSL